MNRAELLVAIIFGIIFLGVVFLEINVPVFIFFALVGHDPLFFLWLGIIFFPLHATFSWGFYDKWLNVLAKLFGER